MTEDPLGFKEMMNPYERTNAILISDPFYSYFDMWRFQYSRSGIVHECWAGAKTNVKLPHLWWLPAA